MLPPGSFDRRPKDSFVVKTLLLSDVKTSNNDIHILQHWNVVTPEKLLGVRASVCVCVCVCASISVSCVCVGVWVSASLSLRVCA
jgi:hypothetical protein